MRRASSLRLLGLVVLLSTLMIATIDFVAAQTLLEPGSSARIDVRTGARVNIRSEPTTSSSVVDQAASGDLVVIFENAPQGNYIWYRVRAVQNDFEGWVRGDLLRSVAPPPSSEQVEEHGDANGLSGDPPAQEAVETVPDTPQRPVRRANGWTNHIVENLASIDGCASVSSAPPIQVVRLNLLNPAVTGVIYTDSSGRTWDCIIAKGAKTPLQFMPVGNPFRGTGRRPGPAFIRAPGVPPEGDCYYVENVVDQLRGVAVGYLVYNDCE